MKRAKIFVSKLTKIFIRLCFVFIVRSLVNHTLAQIETFHILEMELPHSMIKKEDIFTLYFIIFMFSNA